MKKSLTIYINKNDDGWIRELHKYAKDNHWSVSLAIRELLSKYFEVHTTYKVNTKSKKLSDKISERTITITEEPKKLDPDTYFAQIESKLVEAKTGDINKQMAECVKEMTNSNGEVNCYFFNNAREKHSFCKQYCWTNKKIWGKRVRL